MNSCLVVVFTLVIVGGHFVSGLLNSYKSKNIRLMNELADAQTEIAELKYSLSTSESENKDLKAEFSKIEDTDITSIKLITSPMEWENEEYEFVLQESYLLDKLSKTSNETQKVDFLVLVLSVLDKRVSGFSQSIKIEPDYFELINVSSVMKFPLTISELELSPQERGVLYISFTVPEETILFRLKVNASLQELTKSLDFTAENVTIVQGVFSLTSGLLEKK